MYPIFILKVDIFDKSFIKVLYMNCKEDKCVLQKFL